MVFDVYEMPLYSIFSIYIRLTLSIAVTFNTMHINILETGTGLKTVLSLYGNPHTLKDRFYIKTGFRQLIDACSVVSSITYVLCLCINDCIILHHIPRIPDCSMLFKDLSMMYRALWDRRHEGATRISQCTRRVAPSALTYPSGPWVPPISQCTIHHA